MAAKQWSKVAKVPRNWGIASTHMTLVRSGAGWRVHRYHRTLAAAKGEARRIQNLNEGR